MYIRSIYLIILLIFTSCTIQKYRFYDYDDLDVIIRTNIGDTVYCEIRKMEEGIFYSFNAQNSSKSYTKFVPVNNLNLENLKKLNSYMWFKKYKLLKRKNLIKSNSDNNSKIIIIALNYKTDDIHVYKVSEKQQEELIRKILIALPEYPIELEQLLQSSFKHRKKPH